MGNLTENVIEELKSAVPGTNLNEAIGNAGFLIEKSSGLNGLRNTWPESVLAEPIDPKQIEQLKTALISFVSEGGMPETECSALWALSKVQGQEMREIFAAALERHLEGDSASLFQALIGLRNTGENVFGDSSCMSSLDVEKNRAFARAYLARGGDTYRQSKIIGTLQHDLVGKRTCFESFSSDAES